LLLVINFIYYFPVVEVQDIEDPGVEGPRLSHIAAGEGIAAIGGD
jgi:hypothetical protein